ncbi:MAG: hypothetical protein LUE96_01665 [Lachnospiraceae bacterium]|nr:hypothetical protein [Lachnospiraceae bacterium]
MELIEKIKAGLLDEADLLECVTDNNVLIAVAAAESTYATEPILDIAAHDKDKQVKLAALNNQNVGMKTLEFLSHSLDEEIADRADLKLSHLIHRNIYVLGNVFQ